jgi:hypothetical protein
MNREVNSVSVNQKREGIKPLDKIHLLVEAGNGPDLMNRTEKPQDFQFIFGLGTAGLTPFEYQIADKKQGEIITIEIKIDEMNEIFQHLSPLPVKIPDQEETLFLKIKILEIKKAEPKEVIKAMAEIAACGDQCCSH